VNKGKRKGERLSRTNWDHVLSVTRQKKPGVSWFVESDPEEKKKKLDGRGHPVALFSPRREGRKKGFKRVVPPHAGCRRKKKKRKRREESRGSAALTALPAGRKTKKSPGGPRERKERKKGKKEERPWYWQYA